MSNFKLTQDKLVDKLILKPSQSQRLIVIYGFLSKTVEDARWRLFTSLEMNDFVEFNESDVVHIETFKKEGLEFNGSVLWIKIDADLHHVKSEGFQNQTSFLQGDISNDLALDRVILDNILSGSVASSRRVFTLGCCPNK